MVAGLITKGDTGHVAGIGEDSQRCMVIRTIASAGDELVLLWLGWFVKQNNPADNRQPAKMA